MAKPKRVVYFKGRLEDKPGAGLAVAQSLKAKNIGMVALWGYETQPGEAEMYCIPKDPDKFRNFAKASGMAIEEGVGFYLKGADRTGALVRPLELIAKAGINVIAVHAMAAAGNFGAFVRVGPADVEKTAAALGVK